VIQLGTASSIEDSSAIELEVRVNGNSNGNWLDIQSSFHLSRLVSWYINKFSVNFLSFDG